jgi:hypothetical protein
MKPSLRTTDAIYTETDAAAALGISIARLHQLLDRHVFNQGSARPEGIEFTGSDLLLLSCWVKEAESPTQTNNLVEMRKRD